MLFEKIYNLIKPHKKEYTEYSYHTEVENREKFTMENEFGELEEICEDFNISGQEINNNENDKEVIHSQKNVLEMENCAYIENSRIVLETHLRFEKGKENNKILYRINSFYKNHKTL